VNFAALSCPKVRKCAKEFFALVLALVVVWCFVFSLISSNRRNLQSNRRLQRAGTRGRSRNQQVTLPPFAQRIVRLFFAEMFVACACAGVCVPGGAGAQTRAQTPPSALARPQARAGAEQAANPPAPGSAQVLQAEFPERKLPGLQEILHRGLIDGPSILMSQWRAAASAHETRGHGGRADLLPSVNGYIQYGPTYEQHQGDGAQDRELTAFFYYVGFYQPVYQWNVLTNNYQIKQLQQAMSERDVGETRRLLAIDIRRRYFDIILASNALDLARKNMERLERDHKEMEQAIADGTRAAGDIDGPNQNIQRAKPEIMDLENKLAALKQSLAQITGLPESTIDRIPAEIPPLPEAELHDALYALSAATSLPPSANLQNQADNARIAKLVFANDKKRLYPRFGLNLNVNEQSRTANYSNEGTRYVFTTWSAFAQVDWTLFDGFGAQAARRASLERLKAAEASQSQTEKQEGNDRRAEAASLQVQWERLLNTERDLARTRGGLELTEQDFKNGTASERDAETWRVSYANALQGAYSARADFYIALVRCLSNRGQDPVIMAVQQQATAQYNK
jgi:outer membrane protein TolC